MNKLKLLSIFLVIFILVFGLSFKDIIFQEGNPIPIGIAIIKINMTNDTLIKFDEKPNARYLVKHDVNKSEYKTSNKSFDEYIRKKEKLGWNFIEQMGSGLIFEKDGEQSVAETRMYTRKYIVIEDFDIKN